MSDDGKTMSSDSPVKIVESDKNEISKTLPWPQYSTFFKLISFSKDANNCTVACLLCLPNKPLSCSVKSASNLKKHVQTMHPHHLKDLLSSTKNLKRPASPCIDGHPDKISKLTGLQRWGSGAVAVKQVEVDNAIIDFVTQNIQPLRIVDQPAFIKLVRLGLPSSITVMCSKTLKVKIEASHHKMIDNLRQKLMDVKVVATTADLWSKAKRSYLGVTVHWLNPTTLERESAALACRRIRGRHTYDILAKEMYDIYTEFHIQNKISSTTTDNASNFAKAFQVYEKHEDSNGNEDVEIHNLDAILDADKDEQEKDGNSLELPSHHRCASHTLNLVAVKDSEKALEGPVYKKLHRSTFAKCSKFWSKQNQSSQVADYIKETVGVYLQRPNVTRWNSTYDAVQQLKSIAVDQVGFDKINQCLDFCALPRLTNDELKFMEEYCEVMAPLARSLDILQSEKGMYIGYLLPVLKTLEQKLDDMENKGLKYCSSLVHALKTGVNARFTLNPKFRKSELTIASCLHPRFKLDWLNEDEKHEVNRTLGELVGATEKPIPQSESDNDEFFVFPKKERNESGQEELWRFQNSTQQNVSMLAEYPKLKELFVQHNTSMPSSAPVERMFSTGGLVYSPLRGNLKDETFEQLLLLNVNKRFY